ncbi:MAG: hypothetical protein QOH93_872 [Chloroflexia bacterium]|jgi:hypothetical protein|nr:hypothetical protein [Chloroflexia bacterium]
MATDTRKIDEGTTSEQRVEMVERPAGAGISYDTRLGAGCMLWGMIIGMGMFILAMILWGVAHLGQVFL